ncbi:MAG: DUF1801 domain-containing protein [Candidatus Aenigmatarchaeota archaeon]
MNKKVTEYIDKQKSPQKEICKKVRKIILKTLPGVKEEMKWGVPVYASGKYYIGSLKDHVNIGVAIKGLSKEEISLFEGNGKTMRYIKIFSLKELNEKKIVNLLNL